MDQGMSDHPLVSKWQHVLDKASMIFTWTEPLTLAYLAEQASKSNYAAETGVYMGASSFVMLAANPHLHLWSIDPFQVAGTEKVSRYFLRDFIAEGRCEIIPKYTKEAASQLRHMAGKLDFCFVDDGHAFSDVVTDIESMLPLVRAGGLLCGHDYDSEPFNEVALAVQQKLAGHYLPVPRLWCYAKLPS
jgi:predicted O-methyltransferase YrrM